MYNVSQDGLFHGRLGRLLYQVLLGNANWTASVETLPAGSLFHWASPGSTSWTYHSQWPQHTRYSPVPKWPALKPRSSLRLWRLTEPALHCILTGGVSYVDLVMWLCGSCITGYWWCTCWYDFILFFILKAIANSCTHSCTKMTVPWYLLHYFVCLNVLIVCIT